MSGVAEVSQPDVLVRTDVQRPDDQRPSVQALDRGPLGCVMTRTGRDRSRARLAPGAVVSNVFGVPAGARRLKAESPRGFVSIPHVLYNHDLFLLVAGGVFLLVATPKNEDI